LSRTRTHGTAETFATTSSKVGLLPTAAVGGVRTSRLIMASLQGSPGAAAGAAVTAGSAAVSTAAGGTGVATESTEGTTRSSAGWRTEDRADGVAALAVSPSPPVTRAKISHPTPPRTASSRTSTTMRRRQ
jgi:hypothetical protein